MKLTFAEAISGCKKTISLDRKIICDACHGSGAKHGSKPKECTTCRGSGHVKQRSQTFFGVIEQTVICPACHGAGEVIEDKCGTCHGEKRVNTREEKEITVPAGIDNEMTVKLSGEGNQGANGRNGDFYITFLVPESQEGLKRDELNLHYEASLDPVEAILGTKKHLKIPVL
jgi:molecular chaperone DnaJ